MSEMILKATLARGATPIISEKELNILFRVSLMRQVVAKVSTLW